MRGYNPPYSQLPWYLAQIMGKIFGALCHGTGAWHSVSFINDDLSCYNGKGYHSWCNTTNTIIIAYPSVSDAGPLALMQFYK